MFKYCSIDFVPAHVGLHNPTRFSVPELDLTQNVDLNEDLTRIYFYTNSTENQYCVKYSLLM